MSIELKNVSYIYNPGSPFEHKALDTMNLTIEKGEFIGIIGQTGSGKSTLVQQLNGLMKPTEGTVLVDGIDTKDKEAVKEGLRQRVGLVFQYPEHQLFEETVEKDIAFGPKNMELAEEEVDRRVREAMDAVGLSFEEYKDRSPFDLSGGEKRRVAIAGVLAMKPEYLVLDEPTAGLDPGGREEILTEIFKIFKKQGITIILVSHSMEDIARLATRIIVMHEGQLVLDDAPRSVFRQSAFLRQMGLDVPQVWACMEGLKNKGLPVEEALTVDEAYEALLKVLERGQGHA